MAEPVPLDSNWLRANPVPAPDFDADKNARGRVLAVGGGARVPGGLLLTGEAALRAGAGKLQMATVEAAALATGIALPEASVIPLRSGPDGEIAGPLDAAMPRCDALVAGPAMSDEPASLVVLDAVLGLTGWTGCAVLDAGVLMVVRQRAAAVRALARTPVMTPHIGEIAAMLDVPADEINADRTAAVRSAAEHYGAVVVLKGSTTLVSGPDGGLLAFAGGGVGLATGGSGDVLAGIAAGLAARGADPLTAAGWAVWLHGEAGRRCAERIGPIGFLSRELLALVPALLGGA